MALFKKAHFLFFNNNTSLTTYSPFWNLIGLKASAIVIRSYGSSDFNNSIFERKASYFSLFFIIASFTRKLKHSRSSSNNTQSDLVVTVAALGVLYKSANSPKVSPGIYVFK